MPSYQHSSMVLTLEFNVDLHIVLSLQSDLHVAIALYRIVLSVQ